jgi:Domain of unknown function (DUF5916)
VPSLVLVLAFLSLGAVAARAQAPGPGAAPPVVEAVRLTPEETVRLDGHLDEVMWQQAQPATDFRQQDPRNGEPATERTEVRILFDAENLYLGVICFDSEPHRLLGNQLQRDQSFDSDDRFLWSIDTYLDGRSGYFFEINPSGAMGDGLIDPAAGDNDDDFGVGINKSWDGIWIARVRRTPLGWTAEIQIPFRTLNFDPAAPAWGANFQRTVRRKEEESLWTGYARNQGLTRMANAGRVSGIAGASQGIGLELVPYAVGTLTSAPGRGQPASIGDGDAGLDVFYNLTPALRANLSVNTDFAETEVDDRRVNLTRFPLFFEEKRDFFLEGSSFFDFGREPGNAVVPFFSRRIGLDATGNPQRINVGAKITGQVGAFDIGVLQVRTGEERGLPGEDFSVMRLRRRLLRQSYAGLIYTRRDARGTPDPARHTAGADFQLKTSTFRGDQNLEFSGLYLWTTSPLDTVDSATTPKAGSAAFALRLDYPNDPLSARISVREIQPNYAPAVGFVERRGYTRVNPAFEFTPRPRDHRWIRSVGFGGNFDIQNDMRNRSLTREWQFTLLGLEFHSGDSVEIEATPTYERLEEDFEISDGVILPAGATYEFTRYRFALFSSDRRVISISPQVEFGNFFSGTRRQFEFGIAVRPSRGVAIELDAEHNVLDLAEGSFSTTVYSAQANTQFSPWLSLANTLQYDDVSRLLGWQMRFRWIQRPGNDFYFVYTHNWRELDRLEGPGRRFDTVDNRAATKLIYTLRF